MKKEAEEQQSAKCEKGSELIKSSQNETDARLGVEIADECAAPLAIPPLFSLFLMHRSSPVGWIEGPVSGRQCM